MAKKKGKKGQKILKGMGGLLGQVLYKVSLVRTFSTFGEGGPYYLLFFTFITGIHFCVIQF